MVRGFLSKWRIRLQDWRKENLGVKMDMVETLCPSFLYLQNGINTVRMPSCGRRYPHIQLNDLEYE